MASSVERGAAHPSVGARVHEGLEAHRRDRPVAHDGREVGAGRVAADGDERVAVELGGVVARPRHGGAGVLDGGRIRDARGPGGSRRRARGSRLGWPTPDRGRRATRGRRAPSRRRGTTRAGRGCASCSVGRSGRRRRRRRSRGPRRSARGSGAAARRAGPAPRRASARRSAAARGRPCRPTARPSVDATSCRHSGIDRLVDWSFERATARRRRAARRRRRRTAPGTCRCDRRASHRRPAR